MIVVDTSIWVEGLRTRDSRQAQILLSLLDHDKVALAAPVRVELLSGASNNNRPQLRRALSALPVLYPTDETWRAIDEWVERAARRGDRFDLGDLLIGALAAETGALIWSLDTDFVRMEALGLVQRFEPPDDADEYDRHRKGN